MSPAMVDFRSPASSSSSKVQSNLHGSQSFVTGGIPSPSSHNNFRSSGIHDPSLSMNLSNLGHGASASKEKLSVPRLRKHRKRSGTSREMPATIASDSGAGLGFDPSKSEMLYSAPFDRGEDSGTQFLREKLYEWKPFVHDASNCSSSGAGFVFSAASSGSNTSSSNLGVGSVKGTAFDICNGGSSDIGKGVFVFGSGMGKVPSSSSSSLQTSSGQNLGCANSSKSVSVETGIPAGGLDCSIGGGNVFSDKYAFVFGSKGKNDGKFCRSSSLGSDNDSFYKLNSSKNVGEKSRMPHSGFFVHRNGEKTRAHSSEDFSFASNDSLFTEKPDRSSKKDQENSVNVDRQKANTNAYLFGSFAETKFNIDQTSTMCSNGSSFSSVSKLPEDLMKLKIETSDNGEDGNKDQGVFVFGSCVNKSSCSSKSSSFESFDSSFSKLPQKMEKLNLQSSVSEIHGNTETGTESNIKKHAQLSQTFSDGHDVGGFSTFPEELKKQNLQSSSNEEHGDDNHSVFIFGSHVSKDVNLGESSTLSFDESSISKLPDEIKNIKLNSSANEDDSQKSKAGNIWKHLDKNAASNFTSHSSEEDYDSRATPLQAHNSCGLSADTTSFPSPLPGFQTSVNHFCFTSMHTGSETPRMEFRSQKQAPSLLTKENVFTKPHKKITSGMKKEDSKGIRPKNKKGKSRQSTPIHTSMNKQFVSVDKGPEENQGQDSTGGDSPMDCSPYQETLVSNQCPREAPFASAETIRFDSRGFADTKEGEVFSATKQFHSNEILQDNEEADCSFRVPSDRHFNSTDEMTSELRKGSLEAINENVESVIQAKSSSTASESFSYDSSIKQPTYEGGCEFTFNSCSQDVGQSNFLFAATSVTSSVQGPSSASKCNRRKSKPKGNQDSHRTLFLFPNAQAPTSPKDNQNRCDDGERAAKVNGAKQNQESAEEACEKWRLRGNQAYADGNLSKAEEYYSRGVDSLSLNEISKSCCRALMLCYSNRAATRMSLGRLREALGDCKIAVATDPSFLRARVRAGNILLSLGEPADALQHFEKVLQLSKETKSDQKILLEAVDGLEKTQKLNDLIDQSSTLLTKRTPDDATKVLEIISEALSIAPYSEILLEMKAEALVKLRNFDEAIQMCEQTLEFAEKNASITETDCQSKETDCSKSMESHSSFWRWRIIAKSYFCLGKLKEANELLRKHEKVKPVIDKYWNKYPESSTSFPATVRELLHLKTAGNEAFQAGKHLEAVELYTAALALNTESRPFTAICFCNRAAAYQALGQITDAIADCSLAIALDANYKRAISRRATLHEMIRDYGQAATDLRKLTSLLESSEDKNSSSGALGRSSSNITDLKQARMRLCTVEEEARKGGTLDMYMILGIERSCSATDVRKAYRKAALRHHPDKASQFLARSENGDDRVWREVAEEVHSDADRLFKMIGEAYAILVNPSKRQQYDAEEELRAMKKGYGSRTPASSYSTQHERSSDSRRWHGFGSAYQR